MIKLLSVKHKLNGDISPSSIIEFIETYYPETKGLCFYNTENKTLESNSEYIKFYFDPFHAVLEITTYRPK